MSADDPPSGLLDRFLAARGLTRGTLLSTVGEAMGRPLLVAATGSILHGVGNPQSDLDINVVVDREVTRLSIMSHEHRTLFDTMYFNAAEVRTWPSAIRDDPWPPAGPVDYARWMRRFDQLFHCARFGYACLLDARDGWDRWLTEFRQPWVRQKVADWWRIESVRRQIAGRWLADAKPLLAAQQQLEAVFAALESRAAAAGQFYVGPKWLAEKLRALADHDGLEALRAALRMPTTAGDVPAYIERCEANVASIRGASAAGLVAQLWYGSGVRVRALDARTLVSRWNVRGVESPRLVPPVPDPPVPIWEGRFDTKPPPDLVGLFVEDMTWLSIIARPA